MKNRGKTWFLTEVTTVTLTHEETAQPTAVPRGKAT